MLMEHNYIYKNKNVYGNKPSPLVVRAVDYLTLIKITALDLGAGQGRDSLFLSNFFDNVISVDSSKSAIDNILKEKDEQNIKNIQTKLLDVCNYVINKDAYELIISMNVLHYLEKGKAIKIISDIKSGLKKGGAVVISIHHTPKGFKEGELADMFRDFNIITNYNGIFEDKGHPGQPEPHTHSVSRILAIKK